MTLKRQLILYVALMYLIPISLGIYFLISDQLYWFFLTELSLLVSIPIGVLLVRRALQPLDFAASVEQSLTTGDFSTRFIPVGVGEMDILTNIYNEMLEKLHDEQLKLGEQRSFYDRLLQATPAGILIFDFEDLISNANPAAEQMLATQLTELRGKTLQQLTSPLGVAIDANAPPCLLNLSNGQRFRIQKSSFYDRGFHRDFLILEELTEELQSVERHAYEKLIRMTSHEVKNTIGVTNSLLESCMDYGSQLNSEDQADFSKALSIVIARNSNLAEFMNRLALVVHLPSPDCQPIDLPSLLETLRAMFSLELEKRNIKWITQYEQVPPAYIDRHLLEQALINIIKNAYEAVDRNGELKISIGISEQDTLMTIRDSAGALSEEDKSNLFNPFYTTKSNGQGVGLMLVREILNQHGFSYSLKSKTGEWTEFQIRIKGIG